MPFTRILIGLVLSVLIGGAAYWRGSLTRSGWLGAIITGTLTFGFGGFAWGVVLVFFFISSSILSKYRHAHKQRMVGETFEKGGRRDLWQALANGGVGALLALAYGLNSQPMLILALFAGVMATVTADTWATELGVLSSRPPMLITTLQPTKPGTSGGISAIGLAASAAGAGAIGLVLMLCSGLELGMWNIWLVLAALIGGTIGSLTDSLLGATIQAMYRSPTGETERPTGRDGTANTLIRGWRWMNNDLVNLLSSLVGGAAALVVVLVIG
ncbi:MAG: DUF92 domain-containing protein [Roseiflexaceae bacterium]|nr:DUF92 domain-containing protein [Roseiflexaceae bacterium]